MFKVKGSIQSRSVKMSFDGQIIVIFRKYGSLKQNFERKQRNSSLCARAIHLVKKQPRMTGATSGGLKLQHIRNNATFSSFVKFL